MTRLTWTDSGTADRWMWRVCISCNGAGGRFGWCCGYWTWLACLSCGAAGGQLGIDAERPR